MPRGQYDRSKMKKSVTSGGKPRGRPPGSKNKTETVIEAGSADMRLNRLQHHLAFLVNTASVVGASEAPFATALATECEETLAALTAVRKELFPAVSIKTAASSPAFTSVLATEAAPAVTPEAVQ